MNQLIRLRTAASALMIVLGISAASGAQEGPFKPLFNGRDLQGWVNVNCAPETWQTSGSVVSCSGVPTGMLRTERMYRNFILDVEWRHMKPKGNAGVFVWADPLPARGQPFVRGVEVQTLDGQEGDWFTSDGDIFPVHGAKMTPENGRGGDRAFPTEKRVRPSPEWNHYRITCTEGAITLAVNGTVVTRGHSASPRKGYICLESEGSPTDFRNVMIRELPAGAALPPEQIAAPAEDFRPLYNGLNLDGWAASSDPALHWKAADWILEHDGKRDAGEPHLWSEQEFGDFQLIADWRWTGKPVDADLPVLLPTGGRATRPDGTPLTQRVPDAGDSGIYLRGSDKSQVNIWCWPAGSGEVYGYREDATLTETLRSAVTPRIKADRPIGEWNRFLITMRGDRLDVLLNGEKVIENAQLPGIPGRGRIALQHHGAPIQFSNIMVRELD